MISHIPICGITTSEFLVDTNSMLLHSDYQLSDLWVFIFSSFHSAFTLVVFMFIWRLGVSSSRNNPSVLSFHILVLILLEQLIITGSSYAKEIATTEKSSVRVFAKLNVYWW
jgi:hypothetical protein